MCLAHSCACGVAKRQWRLFSKDRSGNVDRLRHLHCTPQCASPRSVSCVMSHYTRKPRPVKGRGNISETTCYCILTYDLYAPVVTRRIRQNLLIFDLSACNSEVIFNHLLLAPVLHRHRLALPFTNDLLSSS